MISERLMDILIDSFWNILLPGLTMTIPLTVISFAIAMVIAVAVALVQFAGIKVLKEIARFYVWVIRGTPLLVQLFVVFYGLPNIGILIDPFPAAVIVFSINEGAYSAETIRAALEAVPKGQMEAGRSLGMSWGQTMIHIVIPQAFRRIIPQLGNEFIAMLKDSSLVSVIGFEELTRKGQLIIASTYGSLEIWTAVAIIYLIMTLSITRFVAFLEKRFK